LIRIATPIDFDEIELTNDVMGLSFDSELGEFYRLEYTTDMTNWNEAGFVVEGDGTARVMFDPAGQSTTRQYRVVSFIP
jgi:hypothetical protein